MTQTRRTHANVLDRLDPFGRKFVPTLRHVMRFLAENGKEDWSTAEIAEKVNMSKQAVRDSLRYLYLDNLITFSKVKNRKEQYFKATQDLIEMKDLLRGVEENG